MFKNERHRNNTAKHNGYTLVEALVVLAITGMIVVMTVPSLAETAKKIRFKREIERFIHVLKTVHTAAAESTERYYVILNFEDGFYKLGTLPVMPIKSFIDVDKRNEVIKEQSELLGEYDLSERLYIDSIVFDDGTQPIEEGYTEAVFYAGRTGWSNAVKIVFSDEEGNQYSLLTNRLNSDVELVEGDAYLPEPMLDNEIRF